MINTKTNINILKILEYFKIVLYKYIIIFCYFIKENSWMM